jgi:hypothetical protein
MTGIGSQPGPRGPSFRPHLPAALPPRRAGVPEARIARPDLRVWALERGQAQFAANDLRRLSERPLAQPLAGPWRSPDADELRKSVAAEPALARALAAEGPAGKAWVSALADAIDRAMRSDPTAPGAEMIFRFEGAYGMGRVGHIAVGTAWRAPDDSLKIAVLHQESLPDLGEGKDAKRPGTFTGRFYQTFDTAADHADGVAPVAESMKLAGLPSVNVFPCKAPQTLPQIAQALSSVVGDHVYAPSPTWSGVQQGLAEGRTAYGTCFTVTELAHNALAGKPLVFPEKHTTDQSFVRLAPFACIDLSKLALVPVGKKEVPLGEVFADGQTVLEQRLAFVNLGERWGRSADWQVKATRTTSPATIPLEAGKPLTQEGALPRDWSALQFGSAPKGVTLDGAPVRTGVTYSREECARMQVGEGGKARIVVGHPPEDPGAKAGRPKL